MNQVDRQYHDLLKNVLNSGQSVGDRTGTGVRSIFGATLEFNLQQGFPILTTKKMAWKQIVTELLWFLSGDTNIRSLLFENCDIWTGDAYKKYVSTYNYDLDEPLSKEDFRQKIKDDYSFATIWGELGPIYGRQWRNWSVPDGRYDVDQIAELIRGLKEEPYSRRHLVSAWNVAELPLMALPPCHYSFQCYVRGDYLDLLWNQRSADLFLGVPFNISSYSLLLTMIASAVNKKPGKVRGSFGDVHLYNNHLDKAEDLLLREGYELPELILSPTFVDAVKRSFNGAINIATNNMFKLKNYNYNPTIKAKLNN